MGVFSAFGMAAQRWHLFLPLVLVSLGVSGVAYIQMPAIHAVSMTHQVNVSYPAEVKPASNSRSADGEAVDAKTTAAELVADIGPRLSASAGTGQPGRESIKVAVRPDTALIMVRATASSQRQALDKINAVSAQLTERLALRQTERQASGSPRITLDTPVPPTALRPVRTAGLRVFGATLVFGLMMSVVLAAAAERSARRRRALVEDEAARQTVVEEEAVEQEVVEGVGKQAADEPSQPPVDGRSEQAGVATSGETVDGPSDKTVQGPFDPRGVQAEPSVAATGRVSVVPAAGAGTQRPPNGSRPRPGAARPVVPGGYPVAPRPVAGGPRSLPSRRPAGPPAAAAVAPATRVPDGHTDRPARPGPPAGSAQAGANPGSTPADPATRSAPVGVGRAPAVPPPVAVPGNGRTSLRRPADPRRIRLGGPDPATFDSAELWAPVTPLSGDADRWLPATTGASAGAAAPAQPVKAPRRPLEADRPAQRTPARTAPAAGELEGWPEFD